MKRQNVAAFAWLCALGTLAEAQTPTALVRVDDDLTGMGDLITDISGTAVNGLGGYAVRARTVSGNDRIWGNATGGPGAILVDETQGLLDLNVDELDRDFGLSTSGVLSYIPMGTEVSTGTTFFRKWFLLDTVGGTTTEFARDGQVIPSLGGGEVYRALESARISDSGVPYGLVGINDSTGMGLLGRGFLLGAAQALPLRSDDPAPAGLPAGVLLDGSSPVSYQAQLSAMGTHWINEINTDESSSADGYMVIDGALAMTPAGTIVGEGQLVPLSSGGDGTENWDNFDAMAVNENGDWYVTGDTNRNFASDEFVAVNGVMLYREGEVIDGVTVFDALELSGDMNENGDIAFGWDIMGGAAEALFVNGEVVLRTGDPVDWDGDGVAEPTSLFTTFAASDSLHLSDRSGGDVDVFFESNVDVNGVALSAFMRLTVSVNGTFTSYCFGDGSGAQCPCSNNSSSGHVGGCANSVGDGAVLVATGLASVATDTLNFDLSSASQNSFALLVSGDNQLPQMGACVGCGIPAFDGLRCAGGNFLRHGSRATDSIGETGNGWGAPGGSLIAANGFTAGQTKNFFAFYRDDNTVVCQTGQNSSNGIQVTFQP